MSGEEHDTLSYSFDHHIPRNFTRNEVNKEFELSQKHYPEHNIDRIIAKLRSVCNNYDNVKTPYKYQATANTLKYRYRSEK